MRYDVWALVVSRLMGEYEFLPKPQAPDIPNLGRRFPRVSSDRALDLPIRARILAAVRGEPGVMAGEIARREGVDYKTVAYHIRVLRKLDLVEERWVGERRFVFASGASVERSRHGEFALCRVPSRRQILDLVAANPGIGVSELARRLGLGKSTVHSHVKRLVSAGLLSAIAHSDGKGCLIARAAA